MSDLGISAAKAYLQAARAFTTVGADETPEAKGPGFGDVLNAAVSTVSKSGKTAEGAITNAATGRGDIVDVVTAVAAAQASLETVVAVRDEVIKAYQDILRMPI